MDDQIEFQFVSEWPENTGIDWWDAGRQQLNIIIREYNQWQLDGFPENAIKLLRAKIIQGLQTFASKDGGQNWANELKQMLVFVESKQSEKSNEIAADMTCKACREQRKHIYNIAWRAWECSYCGYEDGES